MLHVFVDTNIFLNFYSFSNDHLDKLEELINLSKQKKIKLYITRQVIDEFQRRRESKLKETLQHLKSIHTSYSSPEICREMKEMKKLQGQLQKVAALRDKISNSLLKRIKNKTLIADKIISEIFKSNDIIEVSDHIFEKAERRLQLGNPPGKKGSYGDAVNWEILLEKISQEKLIPKRNFYFITIDSDFLSDLNKDNFSDFLKEEWKNRLNSQVIYYSSISEFLKDNITASKITQEDIEEEKNISKPSSPILLNLTKDLLMKNANDLKTIFQSYPGVHPVFVKTEKFTIKANSLIDWNEDIRKELEKIIGTENIELF